MANLVYKQQSTARQNLVLDEAGIEDPVVFEEALRCPPKGPVSHSVVTESRGAR
ncbi:hypothetical protein [Streptomyces sp. MNP-20]|uniref:hypothetical protein n=1 Tax=Streptomyces sp. MNP-20 TaxID=2721165 RepID=UPI001C1E833E|nr:hypothetical protein [Streptomyces sp. MNP-20]